MAFPSVSKGNKLGEKARKPKRGIPLKKDDVIKLIVKFEGNLSRVADSLGTTRGCVRAVVGRDPELKQLLEDCRERLIDEVEESVFQRAAQSNDTGLQCFVLKTQGRHRGWDQSEAQHAAKDIATAAFDYILNKSKNPAEPS